MTPDREADFDKGWAEAEQRVREYPREIARLNAAAGPGAPREPTTEEWLAQGKIEGHEMLLAIRRQQLEEPNGERLDPLSQDPYVAVKARQVVLEEGQDFTPPVDRSVALSSISTDPPAPMLIDRLDPLGHTILYGTGGVGKGALACWWIVQLVRTGHRVLIVDYEKHPEEWGRRIAALAPDVHAGDAVRHYAPTEPITKAAEGIAWTCDTNDIDVVVVDSAMMACGADPLKPEAAAEYAAAILDIGRPVLSLAHVTKIDDARYPFGSVFWHNLARATWNLQADKSEAVILSHRKHNNYQSLGRFQMTATWTEDQLREVWEKPYSIALADRIAVVLGDGPLSLVDIVEAMNDEDASGPAVKKDSVKRVLNRGLMVRFRMTGGLYEVADNG